MAAKEPNSMIDDIEGNNGAIEGGEDKGNTHRGGAIYIESRASGGGGGIKRE